MNKFSIIACAAMLPGLAQAGSILYADNFDTDSAGLNTTPLGWSIANGGTVDTISNGSFGITCFGNSGNCVDLDGSTSKSALFVSPGLALTAGQTYTASFTLSGNDRVPQTNVVAVNFGTASNSYSFAQGTAFTPEKISFTPTISGTYNLSFLDNSNNNIGAILDNVSVEPVPEPGTFWLMATGLIGLMAFHARRGKRPQA